MMVRLLDNRRLLAVSLGFLIVAGLAALQTLPRLEDPRIVARNATVFTHYPGAAAGRVEALVSRPIEQALQGLDELAVIESTSRDGTSVVALELRQDITDPAPAWSRVRDRLADVAPTLPAEASAPDLDDERGYAFTLTAALQWRADGLVNRTILERHADLLAERLRNMTGTDHVRVYGLAGAVIEVSVEPGRLHELGLTVEQVAAALAAADVRNPAGAIRTAATRITVELDGGFERLERLRAVTLTAADGRSLRLGDIARIRRGPAEPPRELARIDGEPAVVIAARMAPQQRIDHWNAQARQLIEAAREELPAGLDLTITFEQAGYTVERLSSVVTSLLQGLAIVIAVLFLTMGWRSALLVGLAIPLTALLTLVLFQPLGIAVHQMSITGMIVALGLMVDNAIIMTNAIRSALRSGIPAASAVSGALRGLSVPLLASTLTTILAFMPIVLLPGAAGEFVGPLSLAVIAALASSFAIALLFVPALAPLILDSGPNPGRRNGASIRLQRLTRRLLHALIVHPVVAIGLALALPLIGFASMPTFTQSFFPPADRDQFHIELRLPPNADIERTAAVAAAMEPLIRATEGVRGLAWFIGTSAPQLYYNVIGAEDGNPAYAQAIVDTDSPAATERLVPLLQQRLDQSFPEAQSVVRKYTQGPPYHAPLEARIYGDDPATLESLGREIGVLMMATPQVIHSRVLVTRDQAKLQLSVDEDQARLAGLDLSRVAAQLDAALDGRPGGFLLEDTERIPVLVRYPDGWRNDPQRLAGLDLGAAGQSLPLGAIARFEQLPAWTGIQRRDGERVQIVRGYLEHDALPAMVQARLETRLQDAGFTLPPGYRLEWGGEVAERSAAVDRLLSSVAMLVVLMIAAVTLALNSFRRMAIVFLAGLQAMGLGLLSLKLSGYPFGFVVIVGIMGLVGVAINATIIILAAFQAHPGARRADPEGMVTVLTGPTARHILSTTLTTCGGLLPLALMPGAFWPPFAQTVIGGIAMATLIAFVATPALYRLLCRSEFGEHWPVSGRTSVPVC